MTALRDFSAVYDEHIWQVYGFFAYRLHSRADAEDLTQQTFERALRSWHRYDASRQAPSGPIPTALAAPMSSSAAPALA